MNRFKPLVKVSVGCRRNTVIRLSVNVPFVSSSTIHTELQIACMYTDTVFQTHCYCFQCSVVDIMTGASFLFIFYFLVAFFCVWGVTGAEFSSPGMKAICLI